MHFFRKESATASRTVGFLLLLIATTVRGQLITTTNDGLTIEVIRPVQCSRKSQNGDIIYVHYNGTLEDGTEFDSSYKRSQPFSFSLGGGRVIRGWDEGLLDMCIGEERRLVIPPSLGYGNRAIGVIPAGSTLIFGTKLMAIDGVPDQEPLPPSTPQPPVATTTSAVRWPGTTSSSLLPFPTTHVASSSTSSISSPAPTSIPDDQDPPSGGGGECRLLGPFALFVQAGLGVVALFSLVIKRYRERPRRPVKIWFFDASKQVFGSALLHVLNLLMSMFSSGDFAITSATPRLTAQLHDQISAQVHNVDGHTPNPCSFYLINLGIDTTIGVPILIIILRLLHRVAAQTPLARPPESIRSGHYGQPPRARWWLKQSLLYFAGLVLMKLCVLFLVTLLPWIAWVGDWALRWTEGSEALQITFVMFVFPVIMNAIQYYIIDSFIKEPNGLHSESSDETDHDDDESGEFLNQTAEEDGSDDETLQGHSTPQSIRAAAVHKDDTEVGSSGSSSSARSRDALLGKRGV